MRPSTRTQRFAGVWRVAGVAGLGALTGPGQYSQPLPLHQKQTPSAMCRNEGSSPIPWQFGQRQAFPFLSAPGQGQGSGLSIVAVMVLRVVGLRGSGVSRRRNSHGRGAGPQGASPRTPRGMSELRGSRILRKGQRGSTSCGCQRRSRSWPLPWSGSRRGASGLCGSWF